MSFRSIIVARSDCPHPTLPEVQPEKDRQNENDAMRRGSVCKYVLIVVEEILSSDSSGTELIYRSPSPGK